MLKPWKTCKQCGNEYEGSRLSKFCSKTCAMKYRVINQDLTFDRVCRSCGTSFTTKIQSQIYCKRSCRVSDRSNEVKPFRSEDDLRKDKNDKNLAKILLNLDVDEFCRNFIIHAWQRGDDVEKRRLEVLNPDIDFARL